MHGTAFVAIMAAAMCVPALRVWPLLWLVPVTVYGTVVAVVPPLRATFRPWLFGQVTAPSAIATSVIAAGACAVLTAFQVFMRPDVSAYAGFLPVSWLGGAVVAGVLFSVVNALLEEVIFRGILFDAVEAQWGIGVAVVATAGLFGFGHLHGYPPGPLGAVLAGLFGLCLGWLRAVTGGIGQPIVAHVAADATIVVLVARACSG
jgi:membrane protease YdiL (CAAX protease family)